MGKRAHQKSGGAAFKKTAPRCAQDLSVKDGQTPHLRGEKRFSPRTRRGRKQVLFKASGGNAARLF